MILAAGLGERMRPLTEARAKPSLPLVSRPIIVQTLAYLHAHGISEAVINLHHQPESIRGIVGDGRRIGVRVHYSDEPVILGTAGGLKKAESFFRDSGTFILINSDFVTDCDLAGAIEAHRRSGALATLVLVPRRPGAPYGEVLLSTEGRVVSIAGLPAPRPASSPPGQGPDPAPGEAPGRSGNPGEPPSYTFTGIHVLEPGVLDAIPGGVPYEINRQVYPDLMMRGAVIGGHVHPGAWREMGTPRLYLDGNIAALSEHLDPSLASLEKPDGIFLDRVVLPATTVAGPPVYVGRGSSFGVSCSLQGGVIVGRQCRIGSHCALQSSILWDGARLGDRVQIADCIVTSGVFIPPMTSLTGRILFRVDGYQGRKDGLERVGSSWAAKLT